MPRSSGITGLERATVAFPDGTVAVRDATLLAEPGELLTVVGPSGSGKTSMLRAIAGLATLRSGRAVIDGQYTVGPPQSRGVAMVFEQDQLMPFLSVAGNLSFALGLGGVPADETRERVGKQARALRINRLMPRKADTLSPGERARVGIGRELVREPRVFLLDEPLAHLDAQHRAEVRRHIRDAVKQAGVTTMWVTHDHAEAMAVGDRVAVVNNGAVVQVGTARTLYDEPVDAFVADFVGSASIGLLPAHVVVADGMAGFQVGTRTLPTWTPLPAQLQGYRGRPVLIGIRGEDVYEHPQPEHGTVTGTVEAVEPTGRHTHVCLRVGDHRLNARFDGRSRVWPGDVVTVGVDAARAHVFDAATRQALSHPAVD